jgi:outer membrane lipoprotein-sorting protein
MRNFIFVLASVFAFGCQAQMQAWQRDRAIEHLEKVTNYHGRYTEVGVLDSGEPVVSDIWFQAPGKYTIVVREPAKLAGSFMETEGEKIQLYDPQTHVALIFKNMPAMTKEAGRALLISTYDQNAKLFNFTLGAYSKVATQKTIALNFKSKVKDSALLSGSSQIYDTYSFPLATDLNFATGAKYAFVYNQISFNDGAQPPLQKIPAEALKSEWDFNSKSYSLKDAQVEAKNAGFQFELPKSEMKLVKIIRQNGPLAAFTAFYAEGPNVLSVMAFKNYNLPHVARGLKIGPGRLSPNPHMSTYAVTKGETNYIYSSNLPIDALLAAAK